MTPPQRSRTVDGHGSTGPARASWPLLAQLKSVELSAQEKVCVPRARSVRIEALGRLARHDEGAALELLGLLEPELASLCRRLVRLGTDPEDAEALTVSVAWEVVTRPRKGPRTRTVTDLVELIWRAVRQEAGVRRRAFETVPLIEELDVAVVDPDRLEHWPGLLAAAVAAGVLNPRQVVIIAQCRMEERSLSEVARALGRPYEAVRKERLRAEKALRDFAISYDWSVSG